MTWALATGLAGLSSLIVLVQLAFEVDALASHGCSDTGAGRRHGNTDGGEAWQEGEAGVESWKVMLGLGPFGPVCGLSGMLREARGGELVYCSIESFSQKQGSD
jgi:hypothetical protein